MTAIDDLRSHLSEETRSAVSLWLASVLFLLERSAENEWPERYVVADLLEARWDANIELLDDYAERLATMSNPVGSGQRYDVLRTILGNEPAHWALVRGILASASAGTVDSDDLRVDLSHGDLKRGWADYVSRRTAIMDQDPVAQSVASVLGRLLADRSLGIDEESWERVRDTADEIRVLGQSR